MVVCGEDEDDIDGLCAADPPKLRVAFPCPLPLADDDRQRPPVAACCCWCGEEEAVEGRCWLLRLGSEKSLSR